MSNSTTGTGAASTATTSAPLLEIRDLVVTFPGGGLLNRRAPNTAVDHVSLTLAHGDTLGVVGQSGSGKSTLARAIVGLEKATSGQILLNGEVLTDRRDSVRSLRAGIQMVFQDSLNSLNPRRTVGSTLAEPLIVHRTVQRSQIRERVASLLHDVGLPEDYMSRRPMQLSGGQRQRVNIARALASEPSLIIADEPTSALDVSVRAQILELLQRLQKGRGLAFMFISHDLHVVRHMSSTVVVMQRGIAVETAGAEQLYTSPQHPYTRELLAASPLLDSALANSRARGKSMFS
jgi:peptide/nickel transport system ATP-binding protein